MNRMVEDHLTCYSASRRRDWNQFLTLSAEFLYTSAITDTRRCTPFELYSDSEPRPPPDFSASEI